MSDTKVYGYATLTDGTRWDGVPIMLRTRIAWEKTAKHNGWNHETNMFTAGAFLSWHAARAAGLHDLPWDQFVELAIDANVTKDAPTEGEATPEGPTETVGFDSPSP